MNSYCSEQLAIPVMLFKDSAPPYPEKSDLISRSHYTGLCGNTQCASKQFSDLLEKGFNN